MYLVFVKDRGTVFRSMRLLIAFDVFYQTRSRLKSATWRYKQLRACFRSCFPIHTQHVKWIKCM